MNRIPERIIRGINNYVTNHRPAGHFVMAVLKNDLRNAVAHADSESLAALKDIVLFCHWEIPSECWGSPEKVKAWLEKKGQ